MCLYSKKYFRQLSQKQLLKTLIRFLWQDGTWFQFSLGSNQYSGSFLEIMCHTSDTFSVKLYEWIISASLKSTIMSYVKMSIVWKMVYWAYWEWKLVIVFDGKIFPLHLLSSSFKKHTPYSGKEHALYGCANLSWDIPAKERQKTRFELGVCLKL